MYIQMFTHLKNTAKKWIYLANQVLFTQQIKTFLGAKREPPSFIQVKCQAL